MSSRDLVLRTLDRQPTDRVPVGPMMMDLGATVIDAEIGRFCSDPDLMARGKLALYEQIGQDIIEVDHKVDLALARSIVGDRACVIGNVDPVTVLLQGTPDRVRAASEECLEAGRGGGYILGSGCVVPRITPLENVKAMVQAARDSAPVS